MKLRNANTILALLISTWMTAGLAAQNQLQPRNTQNNQLQNRQGFQQQGGVQNNGVQNNGVQGNRVPAQNASNRTMQPRKPAGWTDPTPEHQKYLDQLLLVWEQRSAKIQRYEFSFERWIYSPQFCRWRDPVNKRLAACTLARGTVRYQAPDKGMYEVTRAWRFKGVKKVKNQQGQMVEEADYEEIKDQNNKAEKEKWICDGNSIFEYDFETKRIYETKLPEDMRGQGLKNSPLPFLFGVKADEIKARYWVRVRPQNNNKIFVLEAFPKRIEDARNFKKIDLVLTRDPYLPVSLTMYAPNFDAKTNQSYTVFQFKDRKVDGGLSQINQWLGNFVKPNPPNLLWKVVERKPLANQPNSQAKQPQLQNRRK